MSDTLLGIIIADLLLWLLLFFIITIIRVFIPFAKETRIQRILKAQFLSGKAGILFHKLWIKSQNLKLTLSSLVVD